MTYAPDIAGLAKQARAGGHELLAHMPMEPRDRKENPGPHALTVAMDDPGDPRYAPRRTSTTGKATWV